MDTKTDTLTYIDPRVTTLRAHPIIKHIPTWADDDARFESLCDTISAGAPILPIVMTGKQEVLDPDSHARWRAAKRLQLSEVPALIITEEQAAVTALTALVQRQHLSRSGRAYLAYPIILKSANESSARRLENLKNRPVFPIVDQSTGGLTVEDLARLFGFSRDLFFQAKKVHEIFVRDAEYKAQMEPRILADPIGGEHEDHRPVGLGAVIAGWGGQKATKDQARPEPRQLVLFQQGIERLTYWDEFDAKTKNAARDIITKTLESAPVEVLTELEKAARRELQRRKEESR